MTPGTERSTSPTLELAVVARDSPVTTEGSDRGIDVPDFGPGRGDDHGVAETCERERDRMHLDGGVGNHDVSNHRIGEAFQSHLHGLFAGGGEILR